MAETLTPNTADELAQTVAQAAADKTPLRIIGGGSRLGLGEAVAAATHLSTEKLTGITEYKPDALSLVVKAGTPLAEIEQTLLAQSQRLAFEPADYRKLLGTQQSKPTIGGVVACNISGPRRVAVGACRDFLLGVKFVNGKGELIKNGGKVMKNVTGYDLVKLLCGSYGSLGVLTELSFKTAPIPEFETTLVFENLPGYEAVDLFSRLLGQPLDITGAVHQTAHASSDGIAKSYIRIEGFEAAVHRRVERIRTLTIKKFETLSYIASTNLWQSLRDIEFAVGRNWPLWKIMIKPSEGPALVEVLQNIAGGNAQFDWGGACVWYSPEGCLEWPVLRKLTEKLGGQAMRVTGAKAAPAFHPQSGAVADMSERIRAKFDPDNILNPGILVQTAELEKAAQLARMTQEAR